MQNPLPAARVLVVDDDPTICEIIGDMLAGTPIEVVRVHSDLTAYAAISTQPAFKAVVLDINLGQGTTGFDVARIARQMIPDVVVIYISGKSSDRSFLAFGVPGSAYLQKPFQADDLLDILRSRIAA